MSKILALSFAPKNIKHIHRYVNPTLDNCKYFLLVLSDDFGKVLNATLFVEQTSEVECNLAGYETKNDVIKATTDYLKRKYNKIVMAEYMEDEKDILPIFSWQFEPEGKTPQHIEEIHEKGGDLTAFVTVFGSNTALWLAMQKGSTEILRRDVVPTLKNHEKAIH